MSHPTTKLQDLITKYKLEDVPCGVYILDGWVPLVDSLIRSINFYIEQHTWMEPLKIGQIKQKFCGLRFYVDSQIDDYVRGLIAFAESYSYKICEYCGGYCDRKNQLGSNLCSKCHKQELKELKANNWPDY